MSTASPAPQVFDVLRASADVASVLPRSAAEVLRYLVGRIGQSAGTWAWPHAEEDPHGYSLARMARETGSSPRRVRYGLRVLERLRCVRTTWRTGHVSRYELVPARILELARLATSRAWSELRQLYRDAIATAAQLEAAQGAGTATLRERLAEGLRRLGRAEDRGLYDVGRPALVQTSSDAALEGAVAAGDDQGGPLPAWLRAICARARVDPAGAEVVVEALEVLLPHASPGDLAEHGRAALRLWRARDRSPELAEDVRTVIRALPDCPGLRSAGEAVRKRGPAAILASRRFGEALRRARRFLAGQDAEALALRDRQWADLWAPQAAEAELVEPPPASAPPRFSAEETARLLWDGEPPLRRDVYLARARAELGHAAEAAALEALAADLYVDELVGSL